MYKIIGADQKEYGPVPAEQVRQWILEGRANGATQIQAEGQTDWSPLSTFPEFAEALAAQATAFQRATPAQLGLPAPGAPRGVPRAGLDIGDCLGRSWSLFQNNAGLLIAAGLIFVVIVLGVNQLIGIYTRPVVEEAMAGNISPGAIVVLLLWNIPEMALSTVLMGGFYTLLLKLVRGQPASLGSLFSGFSGLLPQLALAGILVQLLTMVGLLACIVPGVYLSIAWIMTVPLIVDRGMGTWEAMELSRQVVTRSWWIVFCLMLVVGLIWLAGLLLCCVGAFVALPVGLGALIYAYEDLFGGPGAARP